MGKNFDQILKELRELGDRATVNVTLATNQDNQIVSYATGILVYHLHHFHVGGIPRDVEALASDPNEPLQYLFSDRKLDIDPPSPPFGHNPRQPFSANASDKLGMSLLTLGEAIKTNPVTIQLALLSWGNATFRVELEPLGNVLYGVGQPVGTLTDSAVYVVSFDGPFRPLTL